jgi:heptosyltransferase-3
VISNIKANINRRLPRFQQRSPDFLRTLIIRPSSLGDTLLLAPALHQIADTVALTLLGRRPGIDFLRSFVKDCLDFENHGWHNLFMENPQCSDLFTPDVDRVIAFLSDPDGLAKKGLRKCLNRIPVFLFPPFPPREEKIHVALYLASCLKKSGLPLNPESSIEQAKTRPLLKQNEPSRSEGTVVFHPGSGSNSKNYPTEFWIDLIRDTAFNIFHKRILLLGPAEEEWHQISTRELSGANVEIILSPSKNRLLSLLKNASLYLGHDSGITHLTAMLGTHTTALFKASDPLQWAPLGPDVTVIADRYDSQVIYEKIKETLKRA